jgi:hypothetical protein
MFVDEMPESKRLETHTQRCNSESLGCRVSKNVRRAATEGGPYRTRGVPTEQPKAFLW